MAIFLDTGNLPEIENFHKMGIIRGVTTNPTILLKKVLPEHGKVSERTQQIAKIIASSSFCGGYKQR